MELSRLSLRQTAAGGVGHALQDSPGFQLMECQHEIVEAAGEEIRKCCPSQDQGRGEADQQQREDARAAGAML
jgi:hypothetical protein